MIWWELSWVWTGGQMNKDLEFYTKSLVLALKNNHRRILDSKMTWLASLDSLSVWSQVRIREKVLKGPVISWSSNPWFLNLFICTHVFKIPLCRLTLFPVNGGLKCPLNSIRKVLWCYMLRLWLHFKPSFCSPMMSWQIGISSVCLKSKSLLGHAIYPW